MKLFKVVTNSDLTEGRGYPITLALTKLESTAIRLGKGRSVMGSDCEIKAVDVFNHEGKLYVPLDYVPVKMPTKDDEREQLKIDNMRAAKEKAKKLGLTDEDIRILRG